jgi:hypothetical protein
MITEIKEAKLDVLKSRIIRGMDYCNSVWQQARDQADNQAEYERLMRLLERSAKRLHHVIYVSQLYGLSTCVFGYCKWDDDSYICFGCTKEDAQRWGGGE